jgi:hypothetical protein
VIVDAFLSVLFGIGSAVLGVFPKWDLETVPTTSVDGSVGAGTIFQMLGGLNTFLPVTEMSVVAGMLLGGWLLLQGVKVVLWMFEKVTALLP